jgi:hypothetical protein
MLFYSISAIYWAGFSPELARLLAMLPWRNLPRVANPIYSLIEKYSGYLAGAINAAACTAAPAQMGADRDGWYSLGQFSGWQRGQ